MEYFDKYINSEIRVLAIGDCSQLLVNKYRNKFVSIYGVDFINSPYIYNDKLKNIHFPTDYFDLIICNDSNINLLSEIFRILKPVNGLFIWDRPHEIPACEALKEFGFRVENEREKIHSRKLKQDRMKILLPPGIGDSYWSLVKMQSLLQRNNKDVADIYVLCQRDYKYNTSGRAFPFIEMFPFVNATWRMINSDFVIGEGLQYSEEFWRKAFNGTGTGIHVGILGCDRFVVYNGAINAGIPLEEVDSHLECNWNLPMFVSLSQKKYIEKYKNQYGDYILFYFGFRGTYTYWNKEFSIDKIIDLINKLSKKFTCIAFGGAWDSEDVGLQQVIDKTNCVNLLGKTSLEEVFGLIRGSRLVLGYPNGLFMLAPILGATTISIWSDLYPEATAWNVVAPHVRNTKYYVEKTKGLTVDYMFNKVMEVIS